MAIYRCEFKIYGRAKGQSAVAGAAYVTGTKQTRGANSGAAGRVSAIAAAAYRSGGSLTDKGTGETFDYSQKQNVVWSSILAPSNAPAWATQRGQLWNAVEAAEKRKDAQLFRECLLTLPRGLSREQQIALIKSFVQDRFVSQGMIADIGIHNPKSSDGNEQPHAHVMLTLRSIGPDGFGQKNRDWNDVNWKSKEGAALNLARAGGFLRQRRTEWADYCNAALDDAGSVAKVDHRSLKERGIDRAPQPKLGKAHHATPASWVATVHDNLAGVRFGNHGRAMARATTLARQAGAAVSLPTVLPIAVDLDAQTRRMAQAVRLAGRQPGYRLAEDGMAHAAATTRWLRGQELRQPEPEPPAPDWGGHDR